MFSKKYQILVVEDTESSRKYIKLLLEKKFQVYEASYIGQAIEIIKQNAPDLIITDIILPEKTGFDLVTYCLEKKMAIPFIMITQHNVNEYIDKALQLNIGYIISKDNLSENLIPTVTNVLTRNIFGLKNYLNNIIEYKKKSFRNSQELVPIIKKIVNFAKRKTNLNDNKLYDLHYLLEETLTNAFYHAHNLGNKIGETLILNKGEAVGIEYGYNDAKFGFSVYDRKGCLTKKQALGSITRCIETKKKLKNGQKIDYSTGGRGIFTARHMADQLFVNIKRGKKTEIVTLIYFQNSHRNEYSSSLLINEI